MEELNKNLTFDLLSRVAEGIRAVVGPFCEVVVHDFSDPEHSAVAVAGNISGRKAGAPVPDMDLLSDSLKKDTPDQLNYRIQIDGVSFQSSTVWVRDEQDEIFGAICINMDYSRLQRALEILNEFAAAAGRSSEMVVSNTFARDLDSLLQNSIEKFLHEERIPSISEMNLQDRQRLIAHLDEKGLFKIRGSAQRLAESLNVSRASIYNYRAGQQE